MVDGGDHASVAGFGPRLSAIMDLTGDEKTILQLGRPRLEEVLRSESPDR